MDLPTNSSNIADHVISDNSIPAIDPVAGARDFFAVAIIQQ
jgi:hypothetical protein